MLKHLTRYILRTILRIEPGEGLRAGLMLLYSIAVVGGVIITGQLVSRALFLSNLPGSAIPYKFILPPLVLMLVAAAYTRVASRLRRDRLIVVSCVLMLIGVVLFRLVLETRYQHDFATLCALFVFFDVIGAIAILQLWTFAGDLFNPREARRLFPLIAGGGTLSNILFGAALSFLATEVAPANLIFIMMGGLVCCMFCAGILGSQCRDVLEAAVEDPPDQKAPSGNRASIRADVREVLQSPLLVALGSIVVVVELVLPLTRLHSVCLHRLN